MTRTNHAISSLDHVLQDNSSAVLQDNFITLKDNVSSVLQDISTVLHANTTILQDEFSLETTVMSAVETIFSCIGIMGNCLAIRIFSSMGIKDGATLSFFFLSISDLMYLICVASASISYIFLSLELTNRLIFPIDPYGVHVFAANSGGLIYYNTMLNQTFISVVRCLSVAKPLWFREKFGTQKNYIIFTISFAVFTIVHAVPFYALMGIIPQYDHRFNRTRPALWVSPYFKPALAVLWPAVGFVLPIAIQIIVVVCAFLMKSYLTEALVFRQKNTSACTTEVALNPCKNVNGEVNDTKLSGKELQVTRQMFVLSLLFISSNIPKVGYCMAYIIIPEFSVNGKYGRLYEVLDVAAHTFQILFCCCNILVYFKFNAKFRAIIWK